MTPELEPNISHKWISESHLLSLTHRSSGGHNKNTKLVTFRLLPLLKFCEERCGKLSFRIFCGASSQRDMAVCRSRARSESNSFPACEVQRDWLICFNSKVIVPGCCAAHVKRCLRNTSPCTARVCVWVRRKLFQQHPNDLTPCET